MVVVVVQKKAATDEQTQIEHRHFAFIQQHQQQ